MGTGAQTENGGFSRGRFLQGAGGAMLVLDIIVRALARDADFGRRGPAVCVLTIGATIPKFALHPRARAIRRRIAEVAAEPSIAWTEYQSRADTISFYKFDPVSLRRIADHRLDSKPVIRRVQIHDMLLPETFARCRTHVLRLHYRSVMANDRRAPYDFFCVYRVPNVELQREFERQIVASGWYDYFEQVNVSGDIENSLGPTIAASQEGRAMGITHPKYKAAVVQAAPV